VLSSPSIPNPRGPLTCHSFPLLRECFIDVFELIIIAIAIGISNHLLLSHVFPSQCHAPTFLILLILIASPASDSDRCFPFSSSRRFLFRLSFDRCAARYVARQLYSHDTRCSTLTITQTRTERERDKPAVRRPLRHREAVLRRQHAALLHGQEAQVPLRAVEGEATTAPGRGRGYGAFAAPLARDRAPTQR